MRGCELKCVGAICAFCPLSDTVNTNMTKRIKHEKGTSVPSEKILKNHHHKEVRQFKEWCFDHNITYYTYDYAESTYICVISRDEYLLHELRATILEDDECYFLTPEDYETWCEEE